MLAVKIETEIQVRTLFKHLRTVSQNFSEDSESAVPSSSHLFCRLLVYNVTTNLLTTCLFSDIAGNVQGYQNICECLLLKANMQPSAAARFLQPIFDICKAVAVGFASAEIG